MMDNREQSFKQFALVAGLSLKALSGQELEAFACSVSHDLRAPLRAMDGFARILYDDAAGQLSPDMLRYLQRIRHNAQQMDLLIQDLLRFSRLNRRALEKRMVHPAGVVREALQELESDNAAKANGHTVYFTLEEA